MEAEFTSGAYPYQLQRLKADTGPTGPKKVLFVSHTANFSKFNRPFMRWFMEQGYEVHYASAGEEPVLDCHRHFTIPLERSPYSWNNVKACRMLQKIIRQERYQLIHCHTPMGGVVARLAAREARRQGAKVLYTAHGFHFYQGAPWVNWVLYYTMEKLLSHWTECIITLNEEDYQLACRHFHTQVVKIDGVGVSLRRFHPLSLQEKLALRQTFHLSQEDFVLVYVAEFIVRKNHRFLLESLNTLRREIPHLKVLLAGNGLLLDEMGRLARDLQVEDLVQFLGYRRDVEKLYQIADAAISTSTQEGLPINVVESMASGLPVVCAKIRGQTDVIQPGRNGYLYDLGDRAGMEQSICALYQRPQLRQEMGIHNLQDVQRYSLEHALQNMEGIYLQFCQQEEHAHGTSS